MVLALRDAEHTGANGVQNSVVSVFGESGAAAGTSTRYTAAGTENGSSAFYFDRGRGLQQIGLQDPIYTGTGGYRRQTLPTFGFPVDQSMIDLTGRVFGSTARITDERTSAGADLWMFDPQTGVTTRITPAVPSAVSQDGRARATITTVTEDGYILGNYDSYAESGTTAQSRAFVYRADVGFTDLGALAAAGPASAGFGRLLSAQTVRVGELMYGTGQLIGATGNSGLDTFVMRPIPAPVCPADVTGDRTVDGADFVAFVNSFSLGDAAADAAADLNRDGTIDGGDFVAFMAAFAAGC